ncbi:MAG: hypothetical protein WAU48_04220 [Gammaproteobacteria bacterium]
MTRQDWWRATLWVALCTIGLGSVAIGLAMGARALVFAPFAFIGWLIGPAEHFPFDRLVVPLLKWGLLLAGAAALTSFSYRRCTTLYRATQASPLTSIATGVLAALLLLWGAAASLTAELRATQRLEQNAALAPLPFDPADKRAFEESWLPGAKSDNAYAQFVVAVVLQNGAMGQPVDREAAASWLRKSAAQRDPDGVLSLLIAQREGELGYVQHFDAATAIAEFATTQRGWRRAAVELWLAYNPVIVVGAGPGKVVENQNWRNHWLERSARDGSRYAAFQLARELEQARDNDNHPTPDTVGAAQWYAFASAARADPSFADAELLAKLRRRADLVGLRGREQIVSPSQDDAFLHFVIQAEAAQDYRLLADTLANSAISTRHHGDTRLIDFLYSLSPCVSSGNGDCNAR